MLINYTSDVDTSDSKFQQLGEKAVEQRVVKVIGDIGNDLIFEVVAYNLFNFEITMFNLVSTGKIASARNSL